jgi:hypothetical protein
VAIQTESEIRDRIVGTWKLVSTEETLKDSTTRAFPAFGPRAQGFLMYQRDGYMCALIANPDRGKWADPEHGRRRGQPVPPTRRRARWVVADPGRREVYDSRPT